jgi:hypothetical protein
MLRKRADATARAIQYYPPESGRGSNGRPFSVDIEDLRSRPNLLPAVLDPGLGRDSDASDSDAGDCDADATSDSDLSSLSSLSEFECKLDKQLPAAPQFPPRRWWPSNSPAPPPHVDPSRLNPSAASKGLNLSTLQCLAAASSY